MTESGQLEPFNWRNWEWEHRPVTDTNADGGIQSPVNVFGMAKFLLPHYKTGVIQSGADCLWT
jgi:hypothetical protein